MATSRGSDESAALPQNSGDARVGETAPSSARTPARSNQQACPRCGNQMPDLKGGTGSICSVCGFKDSCCY
jgi:NADH pyrophosphatase NudC (nudix superfamily)